MLLKTVTFYTTEHNYAFNKLLNYNVPKVSCLILLKAAECLGQK